MNHGLFEPLVMFFGLCNKAICYMDDILIFSASLKEHCQITHKVLWTLCLHKLFLCPEKCRFKCKEVDYLGLVILKDCIAMDPIKV